MSIFDAVADVAKSAFQVQLKTQLKAAPPTVSPKYGQRLVQPTASIMAMKRAAVAAAIKKAPPTPAEKKAILAKATPEEKTIFIQAEQLAKVPDKPKVNPFLTAGGGATAGFFVWGPLGAAIGGGIGYFVGKAIK